jgi:hypothetical protein
MRQEVDDLPDLCGEIGIRHTQVKVHFCATNVRYHRIRVSGVTVSSSLSALRPNACALRASRRRSASVNRRRRPSRRSFSNRFSSFRYSIAASCRRLIQPASSVRKNCSGWMERNIGASIASYSPSGASDHRTSLATASFEYMDSTRAPAKDNRFHGHIDRLLSA